jgi:hypothetical protein
MSFIVQPVTPPSIFKIAETVAAGAGGNIDFFVGYYDTLIYTGNASGSTVLNITNQTGSLLNEIMVAGDQLNIQFQIANASPAYSLDGIQIDNGSATVEISLKDNLTGFSAFPDSITIYNLEILKNANNDFTVFADSIESSKVFVKPEAPINASATVVASGIEISFSASPSGQPAINFGVISDPVFYQGQNVNSPILIEPPFISGSYDFSVYGINAAGLSDLSTATNTIEIISPKVSTGVSATIVNGTGANITWTPGSGTWVGLAVDYYVNSIPSGLSTITQVPSATISNLQTGVVYTFTVQAENYVGLSPTSSPSNSVELPIPISYVVVAGGGSGGAGENGTSRGGGGGGAGGYLTNYLGTPQFVAKNTNYLVTVGAGAATSGAGSQSIFDTITAFGGNATPSAGSGRGAQSASANPVPGQAGTPGQGNPGGNQTGTGNNRPGAGGGGKAAAGGNNAGPGGAGLATLITGSSITLGGGGGGGQSARINVTILAGGIGGGGAGEGNSTPAVPGTINLGGGGGGRAGNGGTTLTTGGSGRVILRYNTAYGLLTVGAGLTYAQTTDGSDYVYDFTAGSDNISWS